MNYFSKLPKQAATPAVPVIVDIAYIKECEATIAREDVQRLKTYQEEAQREHAAVVDKLARLRAFEKQLLLKEKAACEKLNDVSRMYKVKVRALFELDEDGGF